MAQRVTESNPHYQLGNWIVMLSLTSVLQVNRHLRLSGSTRRIPLVTLPSGTQRARSREAIGSGGSRLRS